MFVDFEVLFFTLIHNLFELVGKGFQNLVEIDRFETFMNDFRQNGLCFGHLVFGNGDRRRRAASAVLVSEFE